MRSKARVSVALRCQDRRDDSALWLLALESYLIFLTILMNLH